MYYKSMRFLHNQFFWTQVQLNFNSTIQNEPTRRSCIFLVQKFNVKHRNKLVQIVQVLFKYRNRSSLSQTWLGHYKNYQNRGLFQLFFSKMKIMLFFLCRITAFFHKIFSKRIQEMLSPRTGTKFRYKIPTVRDSPRPRVRTLRSFI